MATLLKGLDCELLGVHNGNRLAKARGNYFVFLACDWFSFFVNFQVYLASLFFSPSPPLFSPFVSFGIVSFGGKGGERGIYVATYGGFHNLASCDCFSKLHPLGFFSFECLCVGRVHNSCPCVFVLSRKSMRRGVSNAFGGSSLMCFPRRRPFLFLF